MDVPEIYLQDRNNVLSIHAATLVAAVRNHTVMARSPILPAVIDALYSPQNWAISTTRVPVFTGFWQDTALGYRTLASLHPAGTVFTFPSPLLEMHNELFALDSTHSETVNFMRIWGPAGLHAETHFILIFHAQAALSTVSAS
jgi:hypothetical protein